MRPLSLAGDQPVRLLCIGAHPDDIEIGCGGTLLGLAELSVVEHATFVVLTGDAIRHEEARVAAELFLPGTDVSLQCSGLPDGRLPAHWDAVKAELERVATEQTFDLVLVPSSADAHQDHRLIADLAPTVWRDHLVLGYELPKYDGDLGRPSVYVPLSEELAREKVRRLTKAYPSQASRDWWDEETFLGLARLRGIECRSRYAEAFTVNKATLSW
jgi:LmbE family N-acetylglucosaminyl deacetylase